MIDKKFGSFKKVACCAACGCEFNVGTRQPNKKTCSKDCMKKAISNANAGKEKSRGCRVKCNCAHCGKVFEIWKNDLKESNFCSRKCSANRESFKEMVANRGRANAGKVIPKDIVAKRNTIKGEKHHYWKGGVCTRVRSGNYKKSVIKYLKCPIEYLEMARKDGYVMEHRLNMAMSLGRVLTRTEVVHHIDHNPENNEISNLMLFKNNSEHKKFEHSNNITAK